MGLNFDGALQLRVDDSEMTVRGKGDTIFVDGPMLKMQRVGSPGSLGTVAHLAARFGVTIRIALPGGFEMRLGKGETEGGWVSRLVDGPASMGRLGAKPR